MAPYMTSIRNSLYWLSNPPTAWKWLLAAIDIGALAGLLAWSWSVAALIFTSVIVMWYAVETHRLNRVALYPGLTIRWVLASGGWTLVLANQGKGIALNMTIDQIRLEDAAYTFTLAGLNAVYPGDTAEIFIRKTDLRKGTIAAPTADELQALESTHLVTRVYFSRADDTNMRYFTEVEIKNPPTVRILNTNWY